MPKFEKPRLLTEQELNLIRGKSLVGKSTPSEILQVFGHYDLIEQKLDELDYDDILGTEGWRHRFGLLRRGATICFRIASMAWRKIYRLTTRRGAAAGIASAGAVPDELARCIRCVLGQRREYRMVDMPEPYGGTGWWHWSPHAVLMNSNEKGAWFTCAVQSPAPSVLTQPTAEKEK